VKVRWTSKAVADLGRLHDFLAPLDPRAAADVRRALKAVPRRLLEHPRIGERLEQYEPREVRRLLIGRYELHYEIEGDALYLLRLWHTREDR